MEDNMSQYCMECGAKNLDNARFCKECGKKLYQEEMSNNSGTSALTKELGFTWWTLWAWLGLTLGNLMVFAQLEEATELAWGMVLVNSILCILILMYNKYAFLIATIISLNPLLWIINGIYLKNRWCHPKVNNGQEC